MSRTIGVGVVGLGFAGGLHLRALSAANEAGWKNEVVAVADPDAERRAGIRSAAGNLPREAVREPPFDARRVRATADPLDVMRDPRVELVVVATPTDSHAPLARAALEHGKHVLVEKPVALHAVAIEELAARARDAGRVCMPAHCMRFWPAWAWLAEAVRSRRFGPLLSARFERLGVPPSWSPEFYGDDARCGSALFDLHLHDADFVLHLFGEPAAVLCSGSPRHLTAVYRYRGAHAPRHVVAEGGWILAPGAPFRMRATLAFERATADFELGRAPELWVAEDGARRAIALPASPDAYEAQARHVLEAIATGRHETDVTLEDARRAVLLLGRERAELARGDAGA